MIPNRKSRYKSPTTLLIDLHYEKLHIVDRWGIDRYKRLAAFLRLRPHELASLLCIKHASLDTYLSNDEFPGPVCLLLTLLEAQVMKEYIDTIPNPFPQLPPSDDARS